MVKRREQEGSQPWWHWGRATCLLPYLLPWHHRFLIFSTTRLTGECTTIYQRYFIPSLHLLCFLSFGQHHSRAHFVAPCTTMVNDYLTGHQSFYVCTGTNKAHFVAPCTTMIKEYFTGHRSFHVCTATGHSCKAMADM